jgi:hypothetical protein
MMPLDSLSEESDVSIFRIEIFHAEGGGKRLLKGFVTTYKTTRHHISENHN